MIDWNRVIELRSRIGPELLWPRIEMVLAEIAGHLSALDTRTLHLVQDLQLMQELAADLGFAGFCAQCQRGEEQMARDGNFILGVAALKASFGHTRQLFLRDLPHVMDRDSSGTAEMRAS